MAVAVAALERLIRPRAPPSSQSRPSVPAPRYRAQWLGDPVEASRWRTWTSLKAIWSESCPNEEGRYADTP